MKKKIVKLLMLVTVISTSILLSGCQLIDNDDEKKITYTSVYPTEYILERLYGDNLIIKSIYPDGENYNNYKLTKKILNDYSHTGDFFVYNSMILNEKNYAVGMINNNKHIKIIDATLGMTYINNIEEAWLMPSNYLMMASNIKDGLKEYITETIEIQKIESNFDRLKLDLSEIDAELKLVSSSSNNNTILVADDLFKCLESYGFNVISIEENDNLTEKVRSDVNALLESKKASYIFMSDNQEETDYIKSLKEKYGVETVKLNTLYTIKSEDRIDKKDYKTIMMDNINSIKLEVNK